MNKARMDEVAAAAREVIDREAPRVLTTTVVAEMVAGRIGMSMATAKKYLRAAVDDGQLLELKPYNRGFWVTLPGEGALDFRVVVESYHPRKLILVEGEKTPYSAPSSYGPGKTTYMVTPEQAKAVVDEARERKEEEKKQEKEKRDAEKKAERAEIKRREPGLLTDLRRLKFALSPDWLDRENYISADVHLFDHPLRRGEPFEDRGLSIHLHASGATASVLRKILVTGLESYLDDLNPKVCAHCDMLILPITDKGGLSWWHILSTNVKCKDTDTKAEPVED